MAIIIGVPGAKVNERGMMNNSRSVFCDAYHQNRGKYGSPRIHAILKAQGIHCGRKRVAWLMQERQLYAGKKRRKARTTNSHHRFPIASNLLKRDFTEDRTQ
jgi:transposase InsO family protein